MAKPSITFECSKCACITPSYLGKCPECGCWGTLVEKKILKSSSTTINKRQNVTESLKTSLAERLDQPTPLSQVTSENATRTPSGFPELDRVLGGGIMPGSYVLLGGDPGIGKSTLMLQVASRVAQKIPLKSEPPSKVFYIAGEESPYQIKQRAERLKLPTDNIWIYSENNIHQVVEAIKAQKPELVIIDSIQSMFSPELSGTPGSISQIKECAGILMSVAKALNITIFIIGHVTKDGQVSGPKLLEHTVDTVLYFEGEKYKNLRILRTVKNRFGGTHEIGVFEIGPDGLSEVSNPSELFLSESSYRNNPGSVIVSTLEGTRPMLVEIQALVGQSAYSTPRRVANGADTNRLHQIIAVLERRLGLDFGKQDVYINVVGGLKLDEPAADLGIAMAIITSQRDISIQPGTVVTGEIGLTGEVRPVPNVEARILETRKIGFKRIIVPGSNSFPQKGSGSKAPADTIGIAPVTSLMEAITACLSPQSLKSLYEQDQKQSQAKKPETQQSPKQTEKEPVFEL